MDACTFPAKLTAILISSPVDHVGGDFNKCTSYALLSLFDDT